MRLLSIFFISLVLASYADELAATEYREALQAKLKRNWEACKTAPPGHWIKASDLQKEAP